MTLSVNSCFQSTFVPAELTLLSSNQYALLWNLENLALPYQGCNLSLASRLY